MNKKVLRNLSYGVYAVSALGENRMSGCIANSIMQITSSPATLAVSMNHDNYTHECIEFPYFLKRLTPISSASLDFSLPEMWTNL